MLQEDVKCELVSASCTWGPADTEISYFGTKSTVVLCSAGLYFKITLFVVCIVIRLGAGRFGVRVPAGTRSFLFSKRFRPILGPN